MTRKKIINDLLASLEKDKIRMLLMDLDYFTILILINLCNKETKKYILSCIPKYASENLEIYSDRIYFLIDRRDYLLVSKEVAEKIKDIQVGNIATNIDIFHLGAGIETEYIHFRTIPAGDTISHEKFVASYYDNMWILYVASDLIMKCGLIEIDDILYTLEKEDTLRNGFIMLINLEDNNAIIAAFSDYIRNETDIYRRRLLELQLEGLLFINSTKFIEPGDLMIELSSFMNIDEPLLTRACREYLKGGSGTFNKLFKRNSSLEKVIREHMRSHTVQKQAISKN